MPVIDFVLGNQRNALRPGELLRKIDLPRDTLRQRTAFRQISLTPAGRSAALLIGAFAPDAGLALTVTAATARPVRLAFAGLPTRAALRTAILQGISDDAYHDDVHGKPQWRREMTLLLAEEIRQELQVAAPA
jgi:CO/xanthine dehydrogenase FAD-binding subunit